MDSGVAATRKNEGLTRHFPTVGVRRFSSAAMGSLAERPRPAQARNDLLDVPRNTGRRAVRGETFILSEEREP